MKTHLDDLDSELVANYIEEYLDNLEYICNNLRTLYPIYRMDEDNEVAKIESTMNMIKMKIEGIRKSKDLSELKQFIHLKKVIREGLEKGGQFYGR